MKKMIMMLWLLIIITIIQKKKAKNALNDYLNSVNFKNKKQITNGYLLSNDSIYNCIAFVKNKRLIIVQTTVDLLENNTYQKITSFNY